MQRSLLLSVEKQEKKRLRGEGGLGAKEKVNACDRVINDYSVAISVDGGSGVIKSKRLHGVSCLNSSLFFPLLERRYGEEN